MTDMDYSSLTFLFTDVDDTLTTQGQLRPDTYDALWRLADAGVRIIPVTGGCAGWCDQIARTWPVVGVVGEGGAFYITRSTDDGTSWHFWTGADEQKASQQRIMTAVEELSRAVDFPISLAKDQPFRVADVAIDYNQDQRLTREQARHVSEALGARGFQVKQSSIHINVWEGPFDKCAMSKRMLADQFGLNEPEMAARSFFVGDAPNDESMFAFFPNSAGVANIRPYLSALAHRPALVLDHPSGAGFCQLAELWLSSLQRAGGDRQSVRVE